MLTSEFDFHLPENLIAQTAAARGESRLLHVPESGPFRHLHIRDLPSLLRPGDLLVVNNTRVLKARLFGRLGSGAELEILLAEQKTARRWECLVRPGRKAKTGTTIRFTERLAAVVLGRGNDGRFLLEFSSPPTDHLSSIGHVPLPPYIKRSDTDDDATRYQTIFASRPGAIAAPTAGLHFDRPLLEAIGRQGADFTELTLHVGVGTFKPVSVDLVHEHIMDPEWFRIGEDCAAAIERTAREGGRIVAIGTTVVRALESVAARSDGAVPAGSGSTDLFIRPGFRFRIVDLLLTNFHLPRSTLLMLACAFGGRAPVLQAYEEAVREGYRFYSYGDATLLEKRRARGR